MPRRECGAGGGIGFRGGGLVSERGDGVIVNVSDARRANRRVVFPEDKKPTHLSDVFVEAVALVRPLAATIRGSCPVPCLAHPRTDARTH